MKYKIHTGQGGNANLGRMRTLHWLAQAADGGRAPVQRVQKFCGRNISREHQNTLEQCALLWKKLVNKKPVAAKQLDAFDEQLSSLADHENRVRERPAFSRYER